MHLQDTQTGLNYVMIRYKRIAFLPLIITGLLSLVTSCNSRRSSKETDIGKPLTLTEIIIVDTLFENDDFWYKIYIGRDSSGPLLIKRSSAGSRRGLGCDTIRFSDSLWSELEKKALDIPTPVTKSEINCEPQYSNRVTICADNNQILFDYHWQCSVVNEEHSDYLINLTEFITKIK